MSASQNYIAAETTDLFIGDLRFDAIRVEETGEYRMSGRQILLAIEEPDNWFSRLGKKGGCSFKTLDSMDLGILRNPGLWVEYYGNQNVTRAESRSVDEADACWEYFAENGNKLAKTILRALRRDSLRDRFDQAYGKQRATVEERRKNDSLILDSACPYKALFSKEMCTIAFSWFGSRFYWNYLYHWLSQQDRCKLEQKNPVVNGRRNEYIHQWLPEDVRETLQGHARMLLVMLVQAKSKHDFQGMYERIYSEAWQPSFLDDLN